MSIAADQPDQQAEPSLARRFSSSMHIPALDGIRGLAILAVFFYHMNLLVDSTNRVDQAFSFIFSWGWMGVDLFFVLSGFLITGILLDSKAAPKYFRNFYARRIMRIFPLYYAIVVFSLLVLTRFHHPKVAHFGRISGSEIWYWIFLQNYSIAYYNAMRHAILDVTWSLAIEEQFYLLWPAVVLFCKPKTLVRVSIALIIISVTLRLCITRSTTLWYYWLPPWVMTPCRMDCLAGGAIIAVLVRQSNGIQHLRRPALCVAALAVAAFVTLLIIAPKMQLNVVWQRSVLSMSAAMIVPLFFYTITQPKGSLLTRFFASAPMRFFGRYSYAMYLFHLPLRALVRDVLYSPDGGKLGKFWTIHGAMLPGQILYFAMSIGITTVAALISWNLYEKQFLKLKRYFPSNTSPRRQIAAGSS